MDIFLNSADKKIELKDRGEIEMVWKLFIKAMILEEGEVIVMIGEDIEIGVHILDKDLKAQTINIEEDKEVGIVAHNMKEEDVKEKELIELI